MKKIKKILVFSDGSSYFDSDLLTSVKFNNVVFKKNSYNTINVLNTQKKKIFSSIYSTFYKKKYFS